MNALDDLIILTYADYIHLRRDLKAAGFDLCYMAQAGQPVRLDWSPELFADAKFLQQVAERRPADPSYRIASVVHAKKGGWLRPDEFIVTFHGVSPRKDPALQEYLTDKHIHSSTEALKPKLAKF